MEVSIKLKTAAAAPRRDPAEEVELVGDGELLMELDEMPENRAAGIHPEPQSARIAMKGS